MNTSKDHCKLNEKLFIKNGKEGVISWVNYYSENGNFAEKKVLKDIQEKGINAKENLESFLKEIRLKELFFSKNAKELLKDKVELYEKELSIEKIEEEILKIMDEGFDKIESRLAA